MSLRRKSPLPCVLALALLLAARSARAQTVDYGGFEQLFGQPVTLSATGLPTLAADVPADMVIITADDIRRSGETDIPGILQQVIGLDVLRTGATTANVAVRGYNQPETPRLLVLVNGRQVYIDTYGTTVWAALPVALAEIRQIEIVKGPNSALFGFNAAAGVINIVTYNPLHDTVRVATLSAGNGGHGEATSVFTLRLAEDAALKVAANLLTDDDYAADQRLAENVHTDSLARRGYLSADLHLGFAGGEAELELTHVDLTQIDFPIYSITQPMHYTIDSIKAEFTGETPIGLLTARAYENISHVDTFVVSELNLSFLDQLGVAQVQDVLKLDEANTIRVSAEYRQSGINTAPTPGGHVADRIWSAAGTWNWRPRPWLAATAALRLDDLALQTQGHVPFAVAGQAPVAPAQRAVPTVNLGAVITVDPRDKIRLSLARGAVLPSLVELGGLQLQLRYPPFDFSGNRHVKPTIVDNAEISWDRIALPGETHFHAALFAQTTEAVQVLIGPTAFVNEALVGTSANIGNSHEIGAEVSLDGRLPLGLRWTTGISPRAVHDDFPAASDTARTATDYRDSTPRLTAVAGLGWSGSRWELDGHARYQSRSLAVYAPTPTEFSLVPVPAFVSFDARAAYRLTDRITLSFTGQNLGAPQQRQSSITAVDRRVEATLQVRF
jgi:iron complex outermembrane receptor protein